MEVEDSHTACQKLEKARSRSSARRNNADGERSMNAICRIVEMNSRRREMADLLPKYQVALNLRLIALRMSSAGSA